MNKFIVGDFNTNSQLALIFDKYGEPTVIPRNLKRHHIAEWCDASEEFIRLNVISLSGDDAKMHLAGRSQLKKEEACKQTANSALRNHNKDWASVERHGGWGVDGINPLEDFSQAVCSSVKPDEPRQRVEGNKVKILKYESPGGIKKLCFLPNIGEGDARKVWEQHNRTCAIRDVISEDSFNCMAAKLRKCDYGAFWKWVKNHPAIVIFLVEGAKKAGALFNLGLVAISAQGMWDFNVPVAKDADGKRIDRKIPEIKPELKALNLKGRPVYVAIDEDAEKSNARKRGEQARFRLSASLMMAGAKPFMVRWNSEKGKGPDDLIHNEGPKPFMEAIAEATDIKSASAYGTIDRALTRKADITLNQKILEIDLSAIAEKKLVIVKSAKGTGKTQHFLKKIAANAKKSLAIGHLINLMKSLCEQIGFKYREDVFNGFGVFVDRDTEEIVEKIGTVINSILAFPAREYIGATIILDEGTQMIRQMLTATTIGERGIRSAVLNRFREILVNAGQIVVTDADIDDDTIEYLEALIGDDTKAFFINNEYVREGYDVTMYEAKNNSAIIRDAIARYKEEYAKGAEGKHVVVPCDAKTAVERICKEVREELPKARIYEISSDTSKDEINQAFATNPDEWLDYEDGHAPALIVYSPSLGTGTSIHTDRVAAVYGIFGGGSVLDSDILQMLGRVRTTAPRYVWARDTGKAFCKLSRSTNPEDIKDELKDTSNAIALVMQSQLTEPVYRAIKDTDWTGDVHIDMYCKIMAKRNRAMLQLRQLVEARLTLEGNTIVSRNYDDDEATKARLKLLGEMIKKEEAEATVARPDISDKEADDLAKKKEKEGLEPEERQTLAKHTLTGFYCTVLTAQMVVDDGNGQRRREIRAYEELYDEDLAKRRNLNSIQQQAVWGLGVCPQDLGKQYLSHQARMALDLKFWIEREDSWTNKDERLLTFKNMCLRSPDQVKQIKQATGVTVSEAMSAQQILSAFLAQVGVKVICKQKRVNGKKVRTYSIDREALDEQVEIVERRAVKRETQSEQGFQGGTPPLGGTPFSINNLTGGGVPPASELLGVDDQISFLDDREHVGVRVSSDLIPGIDV